MKKILLFFCVVLLVSCNGFTPAIQNESEPSVQKEWADNQFVLANIEYQQLIEKKGLNRSLKTDEMPVAYQIETAAWIAECTEDDAELNNLLNKYGLIDDMYAIAEKYELNKCIEIRQNLARSSDSSGRETVIDIDFTLLEKGDILVCARDSSNRTGWGILLGIIVAGKWKHAGIYDPDYFTTPDKSEYVVLTASDENDVTEEKDGKYVGYETKTHWNTYDSVGLYRVKNATAEEKEKAVAEARKYYGKKYGISGKNNTETFYCSKLVYKGWKSQGYDLDATFLGLSDDYVTPSELVSTKKVEQIKTY